MTSNSESMRKYLRGRKNACTYIPHYFWPVPTTSVRLVPKQACHSVNRLNEEFKSTSHSFIFISVKEGCPSDDELEELSLSIGNSWESLARRLGFSKGDITGFQKNNEEYQKKALEMLFGWKENNGSNATYKVLHFALCHRFVKRRDLAEELCCC